MYNPDWLRFLKRAVRAGLGTDHLLKPDVRVRTSYIGSRYGGWHVAVDPLQNVTHRPVVLSFGLGDDISFDRALAAQFGAKIYGFDPTPVSITWLERNEKPESMEIFPIGLSKVDGSQTFSCSGADQRGNFSVKGNADIQVSCPVMRYTSILQMLKVSRPDILKLDIEGSEFDVLPEILAQADLPRQLLIEFHHRLHGLSVRDTMRAVTQIRRSGYRLFKVSPAGQELSFILEEDEIRLAA